MTRIKVKEYGKYKSGIVEFDHMDNLWDLQYLSNEFSKLSQEKKDYSKKIFMEMAACDGYVDPREVSIINKL